MKTFDWDYMDDDEATTYQEDLDATDAIQEERRTEEERAIMNNPNLPPEQCMGDDDLVVVPTHIEEMVSEKHVVKPGDRKPHADLAGYIGERRVLKSSNFASAIGGHVVIIDRKNGGDWIDATERWIVVHLPTTVHIAVGSRRTAYDVMKSAACGEDAFGLLQDAYETVLAAIFD